MLGVLLVLIMAGSISLGYLAGISGREVSMSISYSILTGPPQYPFSLISAQPVRTSEFNSSYEGFLGFDITVRNVANATVYYEDLFGSSLGLRILPSAAVHLVPSPYPLKSCPVSPKSIQPGASESIITPVNSARVLQVVQRGSFVANLTLGWDRSEGAISNGTSFWFRSPFPRRLLRCESCSSNHRNGLQRRPEYGRFWFVVLQHSSYPVLVGLHPLRIRTTSE